MSHGDERDDPQDEKPHVDGTAPSQQEHHDPETEEDTASGGAAD